MNQTPFIDNLQYSNWNDEIFSQIKRSPLHAIHVTIVYHEMFREMVANIINWNRYFEQYADIIFLGKTADDVKRAQREGRTAIFFGAQNASLIEDDIGLVEICHQLGLRFMQLTYNNQSLLAGGCFEEHDSGITRFGRQVIGEMNRVGMVIDMSHSGERSTLEAIELSSRPIAITHANPHCWQPARRNKSDNILKALTQSGGMFGFSLYPHHLKDGASCSLEMFCQMIADIVAQYGIEHFGIGSDLCQNQPDNVVEWMRNGRWSKKLDYGEGSSDKPGFPPALSWYKNNEDFINLQTGLRQVGFSSDEIGAILGGNWLRFYQTSFGGQDAG